MLAGGVCLACVPPLPNNSPDRAWPDSAPPLGMLSTLVEWGVMRLLRSSFVEMRPEPTSSSPIFGKGDARYVDSVGDHSLEPSPRPLQFSCTRGWPIGVRAHQHLTSRSTRLAFTSVVRCPPWSSCKRKTGCPSNIWLNCLLQSVCCLPASPALSSRWPGALTLACPSDYRLRKGPTLPDGGARPARSLSPCPN